MVHVSEKVKQEFCRFCTLLYQRGLVAGIGGNVCVRVEDAFLLTPTGYSLRNLEVSMVSVLSTKGEHLQGLPPTKDANLHLGVLNKRREAKVSCHLHGAHIIAASSLMNPGANSLPPLTPGFTYFAYPLPMLPFLVPGSNELVSEVTDKLGTGNRKALLLQNHGLITLGKDYQEAMDIAEEIEEAAHIFVLTQGKGRILTEQEVRAIRALGGA